MQSGFSLQACLLILENKRNQVSIQLIQEQLQQGQSIETFFDQVLPIALRTHFLSFLRFLPFCEALQLALKLNEYDHNTSRKLIRSLAGPMLMLVGCLAGIQLFSLLCFPVLLALMQDFELDLTMLQLARMFLLAGITLVFGVIFMMLATLLYFAGPKRQVLGYVLLCRLHMGAVLRHFLSTQFAYYFHQCTAMGNSTQATLTMLQGLKRKPLLVFLAYHVEQALLKGLTMDDAMSHLYLDPSLGRFMQIAIHSSSLKEMLVSYIEQSEAKGNLICKRWTRRITVFAYGSIGVLVILIYQILLLPLSIMGQV